MKIGIKLDVLTVKKWKYGYIKSTVNILKLFSFFFYFRRECDK